MNSCFEILRNCIDDLAVIRTIGYCTFFQEAFWFQIKAANLERFRAIASEPKDKNAFKIENYNGLKGVLENFQKKIFKVEGDVNFLFLVLQ